jgi:5'-AMP-activated protein kinase catalytic alpha subunit
MKQHPWWKKYAANYHPEGLIVGYHKIPVDFNILKEVKILNLDIESCQQSLEANRHNNLTTTYYLFMKKFLRNGGVSKADPSCK